MSAAGSAESHLQASQQVPFGPLLSHGAESFVGKLLMGQISLGGIPKAIQLARGDKLVQKCTHARHLTLQQAITRCGGAGEIARLAMKRGLINCNGKTPDATMASALYTDLKRRDVNSIFIRPHEGLFGLREWTAEENGHFEVCARSYHLVYSPIVSSGAWWNIARWSTL